MRSNQPAHWQSLVWTTSPMGGVNRGLLGSKGLHSTDDLVLLSVDPAHRCALFAHLCKSNLIVPFRAPSCSLLVKG